ncbi:MAG: oligosaccharide flippase family protein [Clostridia bacterium]|nr:oligosaccharide flippase family protein [Clostridia bacterium]
MGKIKRLVSQLKANIFWKSVAVLVSGTALAQLIGIFTTPVISRLYDPRAFGEYAILVSTAAIILSIVTLGLNSAVMVPISDDESDEVLMVAFFTMLFLSTAILMVMLVTSPFIHFFDPGINYILACILVYGFIVINSLRGLLNIYVNRKRLNRVLFYNALIGALATLLITIPLGVLELGSFGLIIAAIIGGVVSIIQMICHNNPFKRLPNLSTFKNVYRRYKDFILYQYPSNFIENFAIQLPTQTFSITFGNANLGSYSMNEKILGIPIRLIGTPINTIYFRTASEYYKQGKNLAEFTFSLITKIMLVAFLPIVVTVFWGEQIFSWVLGTNWSEAGKLAGFLIVQYVFMFCANCTSYCRVAIGKQKTNLVVSILRLAIIGTSIFAGIYLFGDLFNTIIFFTIASTLYLIIDMAINFYCMGKYWVRYTVFAVVYFSVIMLLWFWSSTLN